MQRCPTCPWHDTHYPVPSQGPLNASVMLLGEGPGVQESERMQPFVGKTGEELNKQYLPLSGLIRHQCMVVNTMACYPPGGKLDPTNAKHRAMVAGCAQYHLQPLIARVRPKLIVAMGHWAIRHTVGELDLEMDHGIPRTQGGCTVMPFYHPSLGIHMPEMMTAIRQDWTRLRWLREGRLKLLQDEYPNPDYRVVTTDMDLGDSALPMAIDTETQSGGAAFCLTYSTQPGTGYMILADNAATLSNFGRAVSKWRGPVLIHNCLFDLPVLRSMGVHVPWARLRDTMITAYHLGNCPQGLKQLAYRYLGCRQQSFEDLVMPYATEAAVYYLEQAGRTKWPSPEPSLVLDAEGHFKLYKPQGINAKLKRLFTDLNKDPTLDIFERWRNWVGDGSATVVTTGMGPFPVPSVAQAPLAEVVGYACRDADLTLRLWPLLDRARRRVRHKPEVEWLT